MIARGTVSIHRACIVSRPIRFRSAKSSTTLLGLVLLATVALSAWLALQAYGAARSHRETTEGVLRDYAGIAAAEYARTARLDLSRFFDVVFDEVPRREERGERLEPLSDVERELDDAMRALDCRCPAFREPVALVRVELPDGDILVEPPVAAGTVEEVRRRIVATHAQRPNDRYGLFHLEEPSPERVTDVAFATVLGEGDDDLVAAYGILLGPEALGQLAAHWLESTRLLPDAIADEVETDSVLFVSVTQASGQPVLESAVRYPETYSARDTLEASFGSYVVAASIRPEAADQLIIGGLPRSRLPVTLALLALALAVGTAGLWEVRRHEQLGRLREDFISSVSHELRTPLTQIRMLAELQADGKLRSPEERERATRVVRREAQRLTQLVENVLQFSRLQAVPRSGRTATEIDLAGEVEEVVASFRLLADASESSIETDLASGLTVRAHREALRRILINLLDNALKYGPTGQTIRVTTRAHDGRVRLSVEDQGPGVPEEDREAIWEPYRRLARDIESTRPGSGVGLAVVRSLAEEYDGRAWLERTTPQGSTFVVELRSREAAHSVPRVAATVA
jgi:signal transduction histidine kinase